MIVQLQKKCPQAQDLVSNTGNKYMPCKNRENVYDSSPECYLQFLISVQGIFWKQSSTYFSWESVFLKNGSFVPLVMILFLPLFLHVLSAGIQRWK